MIFPNGFWVLVAVCMLFCCIGFYRFVWFMSIGYGLSSAAIGGTILVMSIVRDRFDLLFAVQCFVMIVYGIRLGGFLLVRELKNISYRKKLDEIGANVKVPVFVAVFMWLYCGFFYVLQASGPVYRLLNGNITQSHTTLVAGLVISTVGVVMESVADKQKSAEKKTNPDMPAMHGLYRLCRCPNYFGEILYWTGCFVSGFGVFEGTQWILGILGYIEIVFVMTTAVKRVETRHIRHYGNDPRYIQYASTVPLIIPFIPFYHITSPERIAKEDAAKKAKEEAKKNKKK